MLQIENNQQEQTRVLLPDLVTSALFYQVDD